VIASLLETENSYLANREALSEYAAKLLSFPTEGQLQLSNLELVISSPFADVKQKCSAGMRYVNWFESLRADINAASVAQRLIKTSRMSAIDARDSAYGWVKWLGLDIDPENPFRSIPDFELITPKTVSYIEQTEEAAKTSECKEVRPK
jgi:hypothetical protein